MYLHQQGCEDPWLFFEVRGLTSKNVCGNNAIEEYILHIFEEFDKTICQ